ncbi:sugar ABC transporter permease [Caldicellulosiruptor morganii]|uniref:Xylose transport system permease protein XylH n=1 Tax=Caldicellulosiruptor morganii TaxID=1387555 RepID=A0ABY7BPS8_9FIRM|nr:sugar ABC transporter permease [Caldicellulosiruptor morganii]WAM33780.1 sugar ABC transporter permease [Caldicellulosiruptor morganii]
MNWKKNLRTYTLIIAILLIWTIFTILTDGNFLTPRNLSMLARQMAITALVAIGMVFVIVAGHIDLSVGSVVGFTGAIAGVLQVWHGWSTLWTVVAVLAVGVLIGLWQGYWIAYRNVPAFIVTLAGMLVFRGGVLLASKGITISPFKDSFTFIGQGYLNKPLSIAFGLLLIFGYLLLTVNERRKRKKYNLEVLSVPLEVGKAAVVIALILAFTLVMISYEGISIPVLILVVFTILLAFISQNTTFGKYVYAIGGNKEAARLSGIDIKKVTMKIFILMGFLSAVAGIVLTSRLDAATQAAGTNMELDAIAAAILGGTSTLGGEGTVPGAIIGALIMSSIDNGMSLLNLEYSYQLIVKGLVLVFAVWLDIASRKKS